MIVLVTGATAGFGECITRRFIQQGHKVIATGRRQERLQELKDELGDNLYIAQLDVRNRAAIEEMLASLPAEWCNIDILVNNAGMLIKKPFEQRVDRRSRPGRDDGPPGTLRHHGRLFTAFRFFLLG